MAVKIKKRTPTPPTKGEDLPPKETQKKPTKPKRVYTKKALAKKSKLSIIKPEETKDARNIEAIIKAKYEKTDEELLKDIQVKPEREGNKTHRLDKEQQQSRLALMHRLIIRKISPRDIQKQLDISEEMYYFLRPKLDASLRLDVAKLDVPYLIGDSLALYDEIRSMALVISSSSTIKDHKVKLQAMQVVLKAEADKNAFLTQCGVYAPQIIEHLIRGMITSGATLPLSGDSPDRTKTVDQMVGELLEVLSGTPLPGHANPEIEDVQLIAPDLDIPDEVAP